LSFRLLEFHPPVLDLAGVDAVTGKYARCTRHPDNTATGICTGTGSYICPLCTITIDGQPYGYHYLTTPDGQTLLDKYYITALPRPDRDAWLLLGLFAIFPLTFLMAGTFFIWIPILALRSVAMMKLRKHSWLYRSRVPAYQVVLIWAGLVIWLAVVAILVLFFIKIFK